MKKSYTKRQIQEAIAYWKRQLVKGNYCKVNESLDQARFEQIKDDLFSILRAHGPIAVCKKLGETCYEMVSDPKYRQ